MANLRNDINRRVLVIDDNRAMHDDFRRILSQTGVTTAVLDATERAVFGSRLDAVKQINFEIDSAYRGQEGVQLVKMAHEAGHPYAMAFVDVRMPPGWDSLETAQRIWAIDPAIQIVLCTACSDYSWDELFEKLGLRDGLFILKKPFDAVEAFQLAYALTEKSRLREQFRIEMEALDGWVGDRTHELQEANLALQTEMVEHRRAAAGLQLKTAFLEAQVNSSIDGILVVDQDRKTALQNQRFVDLFKMPRHIAEEGDDQSRLRWVIEMVKDSAQFAQKVDFLYAHPDEISFDEVELKDGTVLDRYSSPAIGKGGKYYGRIWTYRDITSRKQTECALHESNEQFHQLADHITDVFWIRSSDMREVHYISPAFEKIWGRSVASLYANPSQWVEFILAEDRARVQGAFAALTGDTPSLDIEYRIVRPEGEIRWIHARAFQVRDAANKLIRHTGIITDITERKQIEARSFQSQKMETVGKLAGGVAHEFNSILTAIIGQSDLLLHDLPAGSTSAERANGIIEAADRAAVLTRQLLAYGRKQFLQPEILNLNQVLTGMKVMIKHLMGVGVETQIIPAQGLREVKADAGQIQQVIVNMPMNACDAMPNGGKLTLETANVSFDQESADRNAELKPGHYVMLAITDTGTGMSDKVKALAFEPFFTTKEVGEGAGLGLSTCYGIIKQSGGHIIVYSELARGTTFKIYLPQVEQEAKPALPRFGPQDLPRGTETILIAEDESVVREMSATLLRRLGYTVLVAANGVEALSLKQQSGTGHIDLLFTDVVRFLLIRAFRRLAAARTGSNTVTAPITGIQQFFRLNQ